MKLGTKIKTLKLKEGLTQVQLARETGLTERTIQRIENHDVEPSGHSFRKISAVLNHNLNEQKLTDMKKKQKILNTALWVISILIIAEFLLGILQWEKHWWVLLAWGIACFGGISVPYFKTGVSRKS